MDRDNESSAAGDPVDADAAASDRGLEAVRREAICWLLSGLMHESRNALQQISSCSEMLAIELADRPAALDLVQGVEKAQDRLVRLLEDLRAYSEPLEPVFRRIELAELWRKAWHDLPVKSRPPRAKLREQPIATDTHCQADPALLAQALAPLYELALASADSTQAIGIACHEIVLGGQPALALAIACPGLKLTLTEQRRLFEPFCGRPEGGTGLGLAIARRLVELHGGQLEAKSVSAGGFELVVSLPRRPAQKI